MLDFLYFGEANVYQENLDSFLAVAEELQLKGLMGSGAESEAEGKINVPAAKKKPPKHVQPKTQEVPYPYTFNPLDKTEPSLEGTVAVTDFTVAIDLQYLEPKTQEVPYPYTFN